MLSSFERSGAVVRPYSRSAYTHRFVRRRCDVVARVVSYPLGLRLISDAVKCGEGARVFVAGFIIKYYM